MTDKTDFIAAFGQSVIYLQDLLFFTPDKSLTVATMESIITAVHTAQ